MKKLLAIIVLGLFLQGCGMFAGGVSLRNTEGQLKNVELNWHLNSPPLTEVQATANAYCNQNGSGLMPNNLRMVYKAQGISINNSEWDEWRFDCLTKSQIASSSNNQTTLESSSSSTKDKITQSKQICKDLGFKPNNEKFADCALKMMSLQFEASNKQVATGGGTQQQIIIKEQQDYNIFDAMIDYSLLMNSSNNNRSSSSNTNCRVFKKHWGADLVCN